MSSLLSYIFYGELSPSDSDADASTSFDVGGAADGYGLVVFF